MNTFQIYGLSLVESKYSYTFTWLGRPIIQVPEDIVRLQELIFQIKPTKVIETGIAHGGTAILFAQFWIRLKIKEKLLLLM